MSSVNFFFKATVPAAHNVFLFFLFSAFSGGGKVKLERKTLVVMIKMACCKNVTTRLHLVTCGLSSPSSRAGRTITDGWRHYAITVA